MILKVNGKEETIQGLTNLIDLVNHKGFNPERIVIERNFEIVPKEKWQDVSLEEGDNIEVVSFVGGG